MYIEIYLTKRITCFLADLLHKIAPKKMDITKLIPSIGPNELLVALCATDFCMANNIFSLAYHLLKVNSGSGPLKYPLILM